MICVYCQCPMDEVGQWTEKVHIVLEEFPFEDNEEVYVTEWRCPECEGTETTYDA